MATNCFDVYEIFKRYLDYYDGEVQGCCLVIADEIQKLIGGDVVAGRLTWYSGTMRRTHWWVEKNGVVFDPMGDWFLKQEEYPGREEVHRDRAIFNSILPEYEYLRIT